MMSLRRKKGLEAMANLHLLRLPVVVQDHILAFLTIEEQLGVRLVCKTTKDWIDRRGKILSEYIPTVLIKDNGVNTFNVFFRRRIHFQITSVHFENEGMDFFRGPLAMRFIRTYNFSVTSLRIRRYIIGENTGILFLIMSAFYNLESLEIDEIWLENADDSAMRIPHTFRNLTTLKFGVVKIYNRLTTTRELVSLTPDECKDIPLERKKRIRWHIWNLLDITMMELKYLRVPVSPKNLFDNSFDECFRLLNYIRNRTRGFTERGFRAQQYVMKCDINNFTCCTSSLEVLLIVGARMRIQFLNVNSKVFKRGSSFCLVGIPPRARFDFIYSFVSTSLVNRPFDYIQKLTFKASLIQNECIIGREKGPTLFPSLKEFILIIDIGFDSVSASALFSKIVSQPNQLRNVCFPRADQVLKFFFPPNLQYAGVHTAAIIFEDPVFENQKRSGVDRLTSLPVMLHCLPNLETLTLSGWNCKRATYLQLWQAFPKLQKLVLESCPTITASCLIDGNGNPNNPINFHHLPNLEFLELKGVEDMPSLLNASGYKAAFIDVINKLGLVHFSFLSKSHPRSDVWIRPDAAPREIPMSNSIRVTRSVTRALKTKPSSTPSPTRNPKRMRKS